MKINNFKIANYKSFHTEQEASFTNGFNIIAGQNNVGKTAFLEAITLTMVGNPHRSDLTLPTPTTLLNTVSSGEITFLSSGSEIKELLLSPGASSFEVEMPRNDEDKYAKHLENLADEIFRSGEISFSFKFRALKNGSAAFQHDNLPAHKLYKGRVGEFLAFEVSEEKIISFKGKLANAPHGSLSHRVGDALRARIYRFLAQRSASSRCAFGNNQILRPDAANLGEVLFHLQANQAKFREFNKYVHRIFPAVFEIAVRASEAGNNQLEIFTRTDRRDSLREDLAIPLIDSGTGIGQVLGVLYVAMTSQYPQTIVIDEPNSFLHPAASRKLIECLKEFPQHQYIIATHSPEIIKSADPGTLLHLRWERPKSLIESLNPDKLNDLRTVLTSVGAKLSDVFGADQVLWVEGETEEQSIPIILRGHPCLAGINLVPMKRMGDFRGSGSKPKQAFDIYQNLTRGKTLLPPAIAFVFDKEDRSNEEMAKLQRDSDGKIHFIDRKMYENYLLSPEALAALIATLPGFSDASLDENILAEWLRKNGGRKGFIRRALTEIRLDDPEWLSRVDAAKLLQTMFQELSQNRYEYRKPEHSVFLTQWLAKNRPEFLHGLKKTLEEILASESVSERPATVYG